MSPRFVSVAEAVAAIADGSTVATDGFTMMGVAEALYAGIEQSYVETGHPRDLTLVHASGQSNRVAGFEHFAVDGLVRRVVGSHWGLMPRMSAFLGRDAAEAVCLPQGQISALYRAIASGRPGNLTKIGLETFVDPRLGGGKINARSREFAPDYVTLVEVDGEDYLLYKSFPIDIGIIRATSIDDDGNCSQEEEAATIDALAIAQAVHNSGGIVICQAKRRVAAGTLHPKHVAVPGCLIDLVVMVSDPDKEHRQLDSTSFDPQYLSAPADVTQRRLVTVEDGVRATIGRRAVRLLKPGDVVNVGTGVPGDTVGPALAEAGLLGSLTLTVESGTYDGLPSGGTDFGAALGPSAIIPHSSQFDFYGGGGIDATFMGVGQVDQHGNVNVSILGSRTIGCGGFVDITQSAKRVYFCFVFSGRHSKFVERVDHLTFSAHRALLNRQEVRYVTERAVFDLTDKGLRLVEVAPGYDVRNDVLAHIPFPIEVSTGVGGGPFDDPSAAADLQAAVRSE